MEFEILKTLVIFLLLTATVTVSSDQNLALGKPTTQSSTWNDAVASRAVDGNNSSNFDFHSCTATNDGPGGPNWWRVDLGRPFRIRTVAVTNRADCCPERLDYFIVGVTNSTADPVRGTYPICNQYSSTAPAGMRMTLECNLNTPPGRYVIIQQPSNGIGYLTLCEVEVYAYTDFKKIKIFGELEVDLD